MHSMIPIPNTANIHSTTSEHNEAMKQNNQTWESKLWPLKEKDWPELHKKILYLTLRNLYSSVCKMTSLPCVQACPKA